MIKIYKKFNLLIYKKKIYSIYVVFKLFIIIQRKHGVRCDACGKAITPEEGEEEALRIVALGKNFCVKCYKCEVCTFNIKKKS